MRNITVHSCLWATAALAAFFLNGLAEAQQRQQVQVQQRAVTPQRAVVSVQPVQSADAIPVVRQTPKTDFGSMAAKGAEAIGKPAAPLSNAAKLKALNPAPPPSGVTDVQQAPPPKLTSIKLTPREPYKSNRGYLAFNELRHIDAESNVATWYYPQNSGMGFVRAHLNVEKGERYLVDFNVSCMDEQTFHYAGQSTTLQAGDHHLLVILEPDESGWMTLLLWNDNRYSFHSLEVTVQE